LLPLSGLSRAVIRIPTTVAGPRCDGGTGRSTRGPWPRSVPTAFSRGRYIPVGLTSVGIRLTGTTGLAAAAVLLAVEPVHPTEGVELGDEDIAVIVQGDAGRW